MTAEKHPFLRYGPAVVMTLVIPALSLLPAHFFKQVSEPLPPLPGMDKLIHGLMYAALTAAYLHALPHASRCRFVPVLWTVLAATVYGITMELCQKLFTTSRSMDPLDALANAAGALTCALLLYAWSKRRAKRSPSPDSAAQ